MRGRGEKERERERERERKRKARGKTLSISPLQIEDDILSRVMKETQERIRLFEESQRRWQDQQQSTHMQSPPPLTQVSKLVDKLIVRIVD